MRKLSALFVAVTACLGATQAHAWMPPTHKRLVQDAIEYMRTHPGTTQYARLTRWASRYGISMATLKDQIGTGAYNVDYFQDTYLCGAVDGNCTYAPVFNAGENLARYTAFWHFQDRTRGADVHGNPYGGYNYSRRTTATTSTIDDLTNTWLYNDHLDDGPGGMGGLLGDYSAHNSYGTTEANYRQGSYSTPSMYQDYQNIPFQPIDHLGQYFWSQFIYQASPSPYYIGYVLHTTDLLEPHHTWATLGNNHEDFEKWVRDNYDAEQFASYNNWAPVTAALNDRTLTPLCTTGYVYNITPLLNQAGYYGYANGGSALTNTTVAGRRQVARNVIPHAVAMVVDLLNCAALRVER